MGSTSFHGMPRYTGDIDILVRPSMENAQRLTAAIASFGFSSVGLAAADFLEPNQVIQLEHLSPEVRGRSWLNSIGSTRGR
jgi:hypothetical protein